MANKISYLIRFIRNYERFIHHGLREHLIVALMVNGTSSHPKVFRLVIKIFLHILSYFRDYMKVFYSSLIFICNSNCVNIIGRGGGFYNKNYFAYTGDRQHNATALDVATNYI